MKVSFRVLFFLPALILTNCKEIEDVVNDNYDSELSEREWVENLNDSLTRVEITDSIQITGIDPATRFMWDSFPPCIPPLEIKPFILKIDWFPTCGPWIYPGPITGPFVDVGQDGPKTSITLDFELPTNELEAILSPALFEVESFSCSTSTGKENLVISVYKDVNLNIILRDQNSEELKIIHSGFLEAGRHTFEIDLPASDEGYFFVCLQSESTQKILSIRRDNQVF